MTSIRVALASVCFGLATVTPNTSTTILWATAGLAWLVSAYAYRNDPIQP